MSDRNSEQGLVNSEQQGRGQGLVNSGQKILSSLATSHSSLPTTPVTNHSSLATAEPIPAHVRHDAPPASPVEDHTAHRLERLRQAVAATSITQVAQRIGIGRTALSLVLSGQYRAHPGRILDRFERYESGVDCPHLKSRLTDQQCRDYVARPRPSAPLALAHYRACQQCPHRGGRGQ